MYLFEVKKPDESKGPWDYYKQLATIPAEYPAGCSTKANVRWCENDIAIQNQGGRSAAVATISHETFLIGPT